MGCLVVTSNSVKLKSISSWPKMRAKTTENHFRFHFYFKWFPALENRRERERARERERGRKKEERVEIIQSRAHRYCLPTSLAPRWSRSMLCAKHRPCRSRSRLRTNRDLAKCPDLMIFFFWVFFLCFEEWMILYIRLATEKIWENVSNKYKMCFLWYFQEHNQTSENIFWNATKHMKTFFFPKNSISGK